MAVAKGGGPHLCHVARCIGYKRTFPLRRSLIEVRFPILFALPSLTEVPSVHPPIDSDRTFSP